MPFAARSLRCDRQPVSDDNKGAREEEEDCTKFLASAFAERLIPRGKSRRSSAQREHDFKAALERRKQKQARSDDFFNIYRRVFTRVWSSGDNFFSSFFFSSISLIADGPHHYHPACGH